MPWRSSFGRPSWTTSSPRTTPCVLVLPPRSNPPGFHSRRICCSKLEMIESTHASSSGSGRSSARARPSSRRWELISHVVRRASGSRRTASKAGRIQGSKRRSSCSRAVETRAIRFRSAEPVFGGGIGRLRFESIGDAAGGGAPGAPPPPTRAVPTDVPGRPTSGPEPECEVDEAVLVPVDLAQVHTGADEPDLVTDPVGEERRVGIVEDDALLAVEPARALVDAGDDRVQPERQDAVAQDALLRVEGLALPREVVDEAGEVVRVRRAGGDDRRALRLPVGDLAGRAVCGIAGRAPPATSSAAGEPCTPCFISSSSLARRPGPTALALVSGDPVPPRVVPAAAPA